MWVVNPVDIGEFNCTTSIINSYSCPMAICYGHSDWVLHPLEWRYMYKIMKNSTNCSNFHEEFSYVHTILLFQFWWESVEKKEIRQLICPDIPLPEEGKSYFEL